MAGRYPTRDQDRDSNEFHETLAPTAPGAPIRTYRSEVIPERRPSILEQLVRLVAIVLDVLLAIRFVLALLGANVGNAFVNFIFRTTDWLVAPFRTVFHMPATGVGGYFDWAALIAILVVSLVAALILRLLRPMH